MLICSFPLKTPQKKMLARDVYDTYAMQYNTTVLLSVNTIALGMFCGAKYTHHTFMPTTKIIKLQQQQTLGSKVTHK